MNPLLPTLPPSGECDAYIEHLKNKYLSDSMEQICSPSSSLTTSEKQHYRRAMAELKELLRIGESQLEKSVSEYQSAISQNKFDEMSLKNDVDDKAGTHSDELHDAETTLQNSITLPTFPSELSSSTSDKPRKSVRISTEPTTFFESEDSSSFPGTWSGTGILRMSEPSTKFESTDIRVIHEELMHIHRKLNEKSRSLAMLQDELDEERREVDLRSERLAGREELMSLNEASANRAHDVMTRLQGVESEVQEKILLLQECHAEEINQLNTNLCSKIKEIKRLKKSFDVLKTQNEELRLQESELNEENEKLRSQNHKLKKRMENLQRKQEYNSSQASANQVLIGQAKKQRPPEKACLAGGDKTIDKSSKVWSNSLEALSTLLDWMSEVHLHPGSRREGSSRTCREQTIDSCLKILPLLVEVLRYLPMCSIQPKHQLPYLRFIHWSLHHIEDTALLSSTARRIGEELFKPTTPPRNVADLSQISASANKTLPFSGSGCDARSKIFFRSPSAEVRLLCCFVILRTLHQADILGQVFDQLRKDLKEEANRKYFLEYSATQSILPFLTYKSNKSMMGCAVDVMLHMSVESSSLPGFLEACSSESWFRAIASALRAAVQASDSSSLEKMSIVLQKLSKNKSNKKYFDSLSLGVALQEVYRDCDPSSSFLALNLRSILFNLNMIKI